MSRRVLIQDQSKAVFSLEKVEGLLVSIMGGNLDVRNDPVSVPGAQLTLTPSATNYVYVAWATKTLTVSILASGAKDRPLWEFDTDGAGVTATRDKRSGMRVSAHSVPITDENWLVTGTFNSDTGWGYFSLASKAPVAATGVKLDLYVVETGVKGSGVYMSVRKPGETAVPQQKRVYPDGGGEIDQNLGVEVGMDSQYRIEYRVKPSASMTVYVALAGWLFGG